jgi:hypothetical protein
MMILHKVVDLLIKCITLILWSVFDYYFTMCVVEESNFLFQGLFCNVEPPKRYSPPSSNFYVLNWNIFFN